MQIIRSRSFLSALIVGAICLLIILVPLVIFWPRVAGTPDNPGGKVAGMETHTSHANIVQGPFATPQDVTHACESCHPDAARQVMTTAHFQWVGQPVQVPGHDVTEAIGKKNLINNFCIGIVGNWVECTTCHAGYGWSDASYDFDNPDNVDCLICHADMNLYAKSENGNPADGVDLLAAARSVRAPTRENCGYCHFDGGGGNGVKHGDLDESLYFPNAELDVHMGKLGFECTECHRTINHQIAGRSISVSVDSADQISCTDCHSTAPHRDERIDAHVASVACQACHVPAMALENPTKVFWDWSTAGQDLPEDHYTYLKIKGTFIYEKDVLPTYAWYNETVAYRYLLGDKIDPSQPTVLNLPGGSITDPNARIFPFKIHVAKQPYDTVNNILLQPLTAGEGGFWTTFDWDSALRLGAQFTGTPYSGQYGFAETWMYWPSTHMVQPATKALQCTSCHGSTGRMDWEALGYPGDPMAWGGRFSQP
jgi:octaheme c-type cytochrome (tetrathionate reductase family)